MIGRCGAARINNTDVNVPFWVGRLLLRMINWRRLVSTLRERILLGRAVVVERAGSFGVEF